VAYARPLALALVSAAALTGCGGGGGGAPAAPSDPEGVIRAWSDALRAGDPKKAAGFFAVPAIVQNNTPPIRLKTREEVEFFNFSLPCGAKVVSTSRRGRYTDVVFLLTDRPNGACGTGTGQEVATSFLVRDGKITEWRRLADPVEKQDEPGTVAA
jgi:hypothetical protein